jgi:hypothetical protein
MVGLSLPVDSNSCYAYRVVLVLTFVVIMDPQTSALCLSTGLTRFVVYLTSSSVSTLQTKVRLFTCRPSFWILLLGACSWALYFACFDVGYLSFKTRNPEIGDRDTANYAHWYISSIGEETLFSLGMGVLDTCPGHRAEGGAKNTSQILSVLSLLVRNFLSLIVFYLWD